MASNTENTEGKLAAYIDGQLDPAERAEIEQYLRANPEHQRLLADMVAQRDLLRSLPRDKAPADVYDAIQAQLERSILLDDAGHGAAVPVRHSRRSQFAAIAAILVLAVGLAGVLFFVLPSSQPHPTEVAVVSGDEAEELDTVATAEAEADDRSAATGDTAADLRSGSDMSLAATAPPVLNHSGTMSNSSVPDPTRELLADTLEFRKLASQIAPAGPSVNDRLVVLVSTDNPSHASRQVASYLESNKIRWEAIDVSPPAGSPEVFYRKDADPIQGKAAAPTSELTTAGKFDLGQYRSKGDGPSVVGWDDKEQSTRSGAIADIGAGEDLSARKRQEPEQLFTNTATGEQQQQKQMPQSLHPELRQAPAAVAGIAPQQQQVAQEELAEAQQQQQPQLPQQAGQSQIAALDQSRRLIIARGMTKQQAIDLTDTLSADRATQQRARLLVETPSRRLVSLKKELRDYDVKLKLSEVSEPPARSTTGRAADETGATDGQAAVVAPVEEQLLGVGYADEAKLEARAPVQRDSEVTDKSPAIQDDWFTTTAPGATPVDEAIDVVILVEDGPMEPATVPADAANLVEPADPPDPESPAAPSEAPAVD